MIYRTIVLSGLEGTQQKRVQRILQRHLTQRSTVHVTDTLQNMDSNALYLSLQIVHGGESEGFHLFFEGNKIRMVAERLRGILYGLGKFLRSCDFRSDGIYLDEQMEAREITSTPQLPVRGIYFASHFHNYYHDAPSSEINLYVEDLALLGMNVVQVWFDMHHYRGVNDSKAQEMISHLLAILRHIKSLDLMICLVELGNEAYAESPVEMRADYGTGRANYEVELCPYQPGAIELMCQWFKEKLLAFAEVSVDFILLCPYDQGGCACALCKPWGANGYLKIAEKKARVAREILPNVKIILSTWCFDFHRDEGEWRGLAKVFSKGQDWCDYIQADGHEEFPEFPLKEGVPGDLPLLNFPEISMWMMYPWGGFGATPLPDRFQQLFHNVKDRIDGGFPYSEGIYEDINKALILQSYWNPERPFKDILREYIAYEYSSDFIEEILKIVYTLEKNHNHTWNLEWGQLRQRRSEIFFREDPHESWRMIQQIDTKLSDKTKSAWRWRILYLRVLLDAHLHPTKGFLGDEECERAFEELTRIYHAQGAEFKCAPPTRESIQSARSSEFRVGPV